MKYWELITTTLNPDPLKMMAFLAGLPVFFLGDLHNEPLIALVMLIVFDTITGIIASKYEGKEITSKRFANVIAKATFYFIAISSAHFIDDILGFEMAQYTMIVFIGVTEFISILENVGRLGYQTPQRLLNSLRDIQQSK